VAEAGERLVELLGESLAVWRLAGRVERQGEAVVVCVAGAASLRIAPPPPGLPFRWLLRVGARQRGISGLPGLLRHLRAELAPERAASRLRLTPRPLLLP